MDFIPWVPFFQVLAVFGGPLAAVGSSSPDAGWIGTKRTDMENRRLAGCHFGTGGKARRGSFDRICATLMNCPTLFLAGYFAPIAGMRPSGGVARAIVSPKLPHGTRNRSKGAGTPSVPSAPWKCTAAGTARSPARTKCVLGRTGLVRHGLRTSLGHPYAVDSPFQFRSEACR
jgi:hypothetical protein